MQNKFKLLHVQFLPEDLKPEILYVSKEYGVAGHLCPCGCGSKIITPLDPIEWSFSERKNKPTLYPSIGNWQLPCRSHYWIRDGKIEWSYQWTEDEIQKGQRTEEARRKVYYEKLNKKNAAKKDAKAGFGRTFKKGSKNNL